MKPFGMKAMPDRFKIEPTINGAKNEHSATYLQYYKRKYSDYGFSKDRSIYYNPQSEESGYRWVENVSDGLRKVGDAHKIVRLNHTGWFTDVFQDETVHGEVYQLPARAERTLYVPAVNDPCNDDCACLDFTSVTDDKEEAARRADQMAERWAEEAREYSAKDQAEQRIEAINEEIEELYKDFRRISRAIRADCDRVQGVEVVRELVREKWQETKRQIHKLRKEREEQQELL